MARYWTHTCKDVGETQTLHGEPCNWCDITEEDVMNIEINAPYDILEDPNGRSN